MPSLVFLSAERTIVADRYRVISEAPDRVVARVAKLAADAKIVLGALPFDTALDAQLIVPDAVRDTFVDAAASIAAPAAVVATKIEPSEHGYVEAVARALEAMQTGALGKVVLSRRFDIEFDSPVDLNLLIARLRRDPHTTTFCLPVYRDRDVEPCSLVGASPELLLAKQGRAVSSAPLAGSARRSADQAVDRAAADRLSGSDKDRREHAIVVEWIADRLSPYCRRLAVPVTPAITSTDTLWHFGTQIAGELKDPSTPSLELAMMLHPTPAVCGVPLHAATAAIRASEPFDRGFYTGVVGWSDARGDGRWMVAIRCAEVSGATAHLFAGAGIVLGSDPLAELEETAAKFETLLRALGVPASHEGARA